MKTIIKIIEKPFCMEYGMFSNAQEFLNKVIETKEINVNCNFETKITCNISLYLSPFNFQVNTYKNPELKYLDRIEHDMFNYSKHEKHYLKAKSITDIQKHVEYVLNKCFEDVNDIITLNIYNTTFIQSLL